jgi:hypothetical protein
LLHFSTIILATQTILSKIPPNNSKLTYVWEQYLFHYISEGGFTYLVMADDSAGRYVQAISGAPEILSTQESFRRMPFTFLGELQSKVQLFHFHITTAFIHALTLLGAVPIQSLGLDFFIFSGPPCTPVDLWPDNLAAGVYVQHVSSDG